MDQSDQEEKSLSELKWAVNQKGSESVARRLVCGEGNPFGKVHFWQSFRVAHMANPFPEYDI